MSRPDVRNCPDYAVEALKLAYRYIHLLDPDVGTAEAGSVLCNALCEAMGDREFRKWLRTIWETKP